MSRPVTQSGFTLVEVLIAMALLALISMAGFAMVESILRVARSTDARLDRLAEIQRAIHILKLDLEQTAGIHPAAPGLPLTIWRENEIGVSVPTSIRYELRDRNLYRSQASLPSSEHLLITAVEGLHWHFYTPGHEWIDSWPVPLDRSGVLPRAIAIDIEIAANGSGPSGLLRRVIELPAGLGP